MEVGESREEKEKGGRALVSALETNIIFECVCVCGCGNVCLQL